MCELSGNIGFKQKRNKVQHVFTPICEAGTVQTQTCLGQLYLDYGRLLFSVIIMKPFL